jgi:formylglycine-generating enzyme required for sulfatase activity
MWGVEARLLSTVAPTVVRIPAAWFWMGHAGGLDCERPPHRIWVDGFDLAVCQVTNEQYAQFLRAAGAPPPPLFHDPAFCGPRQPVVAVSWFDAVAYCEWLSAVTGEKYRLPTEAEWELAARAGLEGKLYAWGDEPPQSRPDYARRWQSGPEPVGTAPPNGFGLCDMCENVHEWCSDWFDAEYYARSPELNPRGPELGVRRSSRGGSWRHHVKISRCHTRSSIPPEYRYADYGLRIARERG